MKTYVLVRKQYDNASILSAFSTKQQALTALHHEYDKINAPSKIIWESESKFKIVSDNGTTIIYQMIESED